MKLYHGSIQIVKEPNLGCCRSNTDFGRGFYTTTHKEQAEEWCRIVQKRNKNANQIVSVFEFDDSLLSNDTLVVRDFQGVSEDWLNFIFANRNGIKTVFFDIVLGPVANDNLYATLQLFEQEVINKDEAIRRLKTYRLVNQISFHSEKAIQTLQFIETYEVNSPN